MTGGKGDASMSADDGSAPGQSGVALQGLAGGVAAHRDEGVQEAGVGWRAVDVGVAASRAAPPPIDSLLPLTHP